MVAKPTVISIFAGGGGSSLGYRWAGFNELLAVEWDNNAVETLKLNFPELKIYHGDIVNLSGKECLKLAGIKKGELDVLDGSPPCQGFSTVGKRNVKDARNDLFKEYTRLIKEIEPKVFVMENVSGMIKGKMKGKYLEIWKALIALDYNVKSKLMNAMWYDVPQSRERVFFIGVRKDLNTLPSFPEPFDKVITVKEAFEKLPEQEEEEKELNVERFAIFSKIIKLKQGDRFTDIPGQKTGFQFMRIRENRPSPTVCKTMKDLTSSNGLIHPYKNRKLTITELKRLCSFPDNYKVTDWKSGWERLGNAVMPKMMFYIAKNIKENIIC